MFYVIFRIYLLFEGTRKATMMKMGPNDASRRVAWAISIFFMFLMFTGFFTTTTAAGTFQP